MARIRISVSEKVENIIFDSLNYAFLIFLCVITIYPFINTLAISLNDAVDSMRGDIYLWPRKFTLLNYIKLFTENKNILRSTFISASRAIVGPALGVTSSMILAYTLSRREFVLRKLFTKILVYTMYFSGGIIPIYMLMRSLGLINNYLVYILPTMIGAYNVMVMRSYIDGLSTSLIEAAKIDGASEYKILFSIIIPLSLPVLAVVTLFVAVSQWNAWFDTMMYTSGNKALSTLQYELQKVLMASRMLSEAAGDSASALSSSLNLSGIVTPTSIRAAMTIIAILPILCTYPLLQRYFISGLTLGGVKE